MFDSNLSLPSWSSVYPASAIILHLISAFNLFGRPARGRAPCAVAVACSPCARAPRSRPLPLAPLTFRLASLPSPPSLRTSRRQRAVVVSHPLARPGTRLQTCATTGHAGRSLCGWRRPAPATLPRQRRCPGMGADHAASRGRRARAPAVLNPIEPAFSSVLHFSALCPMAERALLPPPRRARSPKPKPAAPPSGCLYYGCKPAAHRPL